jgi:hypothetical protein
MYKPDDKEELDEAYDDEGEGAAGFEYVMSIGAEGDISSLKSSYLVEF